NGAVSTSSVLGFVGRTFAASARVSCVDGARAVCGRMQAMCPAGRCGHMTAGPDVIGKSNPNQIGGLEGPETWKRRRIARAEFGQQDCARNRGGGPSHCGETAALAHNRELRKAPSFPPRPYERSNRLNPARDTPITRHPT